MQVDPVAILGNLTTFSALFFEIFFCLTSPEDFPTYTKLPSSYKVDQQDPPVLHEWQKRKVPREEVPLVPSLQAQVTGNGGLYPILPSRGRIRDDRTVRGAVPPVTKPIRRPATRKTSKNGASGRMRNPRTVTEKYSKHDTDKIGKLSL
ncbi:hypothetical protein V8F33_011067 [Rhypophila sp. PSN 637]